MNKMMNAKLIVSLEAAIESWMNENYEEDWWDDSVGYISNDCAARLAQICVLTLEESKLAQEAAEE